MTRKLITYISPGLYHKFQLGEADIYYDPEGESQYLRIYFVGRQDILSGKVRYYPDPFMEYYNVVICTHGEPEPDYEAELYPWDVSFNNRGSIILPDDTEWSIIVDDTFGEYEYECREINDEVVKFKEE